MKSQIDYTEPHQRENNDESEAYLQENQKKFSKQCLCVLEILNTGAKLSCKDALVNHGIGHLPRRVADLKENGVDIQDEWVKDAKGKRLYKEYFLRITKRPTKAAVVKMFSGELKQTELFNDTK